MRSPVLNHQLLQLGVETASAIVGEIAKFGAFGWVLLKEALFDLEEETEWNSSTQGGICNDEVCKTTRGRGGGWIFGWRVRDVVNEIVVVGVG